MTTYTADTPREWREKGGSLSKKLNAEFGLLETLLDGVDRDATAMTLTKATITLTASTAINLDGAVTLDGDATLTDVSNVTTLTQDTITLIGGTKINLDGPTDITGILTIDTLSSPVDGIKINATTPADGLEIASACTVHAINISAAQTGAGITIGNTCGTYGLNIAGACTTSGINIATQTATGIRLAGGGSYNPIHIGTKHSTTAGTGLDMSGAVQDNMMGVMIFCDDGGADLDNNWSTSPIWTRYLITKDQTSNTHTGAYLQLKTAGVAEARTITSCDTSAVKAYMECADAVTLATSDFAVINCGLELGGTFTVAANCKLSGLDVNINDKGNSITDTAEDSAGIHIRKTGTAGWPVGLKINDAGATTGISLGTCTKGIHLGCAGGTASGSGLLFGIGTTGDPATTDGVNANFIELRCETTAESGDNRLQYMRYYMKGINATGGECLKAGTVLEVAVGTARGEQASIEVSDTGYVTGFACGLDGLLEVANSAVPSGGMYFAGQSQIWMTGSSSDLSAATRHAIHRFSVSGGSAVAEAKVLNAFDFDVPNCADSGGDEMISPGSSESTTTGTIRILINGDIRYLAYYSHKGHAD